MTPEALLGPERAKGQVPPVPPAVARVDRALVHAARAVRLLGAVAPIDAAAERARLAAALAAGKSERPRWTYLAADRAGVRHALEAMDREIDAEGPSPLAACYRARIAELGLEAEMAEALGTPRFPALAARRFAPASPESARRAEDLASSWMAALGGASDVPAQSSEPTVLSDAEDPRSLVSRLRAEVGRLRLPFSVTTTDQLAPLAAIGETRLWVATGREVTLEDVERTVVHELHAHAVPRTRARGMRLSLFAVGTARGADEQEGLALLVEERHGFLRPRRKRELALRHEVCSRMRLGASFPDATRWLAAEAGVGAAEAVRIAERAYRGGDGEGPGLGRERVYLESYLAVKEHLRERPDDEVVLMSGQVALDAVPALRDYCA